MAYIRVSIMKPLQGQEEEVHRINKDIVEHTSRLPGYVSGHVLRALDGSNEVGRITIWESAGDADRAANEAHTMALRAELHLKVQEGHADRSFSDE